MNLSTISASARAAFARAVGASLFAFASCAVAQTSPDIANARARAAAADSSEWIKLFNGRNTDGWLPKFTGHDLGENFKNTLRVEDGILKVSYDDWTAWNGEFGHIFYAPRPFSYYVIVAEYRFPSKQVPGATKDLAWAINNNGLMLHSQPPETMGKDQDFPISLEAQLLGGAGDGKPRSTMNLCTPGTHVEMNGKLITQHCINSTSPTFEGEQWVHVEVVVLGDTHIAHLVNGEQVITYTKPQMGGDMANKLNPGVMVEGRMLNSGYITIQAESAAIDFRKIEVLNLEGCTEPGSVHYRKHYVKSDPSACSK